MWLRGEKYTHCVLINGVGEFVFADATKRGHSLQDLTAVRTVASGMASARACQFRASARTATLGGPAGRRVHDVARLGTVPYTEAGLEPLATLGRELGPHKRMRRVTCFDSAPGCVWPTEDDRVHLVLEAGLTLSSEPGPRPPLAAHKNEPVSSINRDDGMRDATCKFSSVLSELPSACERHHGCTTRFSTPRGTAGPFRAPRVRIYQPFTPMYNPSSSSCSHSSQVPVNE